MPRPSVRGMFLNLLKDPLRASSEAGYHAYRLALRFVPRIRYGKLLCSRARRECETHRYQLASIGRFHEFTVVCGTHDAAGYFTVSVSGSLELLREPLRPGVQRHRLLLPGGGPVLIGIEHAFPSTVTVLVDPVPDESP